jgi:hypothetical protein
MHNLYQMLFLPKYRHCKSDNRPFDAGFDFLRYLLLVQVEQDQHKSNENLAALIQVLNEKRQKSDLVFAELFVKGLCPKPLLTP